MGISPEAGRVIPSYNVYRLRDSKCEVWFYDYLFRTGSFVAEVICHSKGVWSSRLRLYPQEFFDIRIPCPPLEEQRNIVTYIRNETGHYNVLQKKIEHSIEALCEYRTAFISAAVTGKIDVRKEVRINVE
jgi:type I restriction enzyme S subunit